MKKVTLSILIILSIVSQAQAVLINLTEESLGLKSGNYGTSLTINNSLIITALTNINQDGGPLTADVYLGNNQHGLGVQVIGAIHEKGITGNGEGYAEALNIAFIRGVPASTIQLGLFNYKKSDYVVLGITFADNQTISVSKYNSTWDEAVKNSSNGTDEIDLSILIPGLQNQKVSQLSINVFSGQVYVNGIGNAYYYSSVPEPATIALLGFGFITIWPMRKK